MNRVLLLIVLLLTAAAGTATAQQPQAAEPTSVRIHPHYRSEIAFPDPIVRVTGTALKSGFTFTYKGNVLSISPVRWPKDDPKFQVRTTVNVFAAARAWQLDLDYDFAITRHIHYIGFDPKDAKDAPPVQDGRPLNDPLDTLFIRFILASGKLPFLPARESDDRIETPTGTVQIRRTYSFRNHIFIYAELTNNKAKLPIDAAASAALALFPDRQGQMFTPALHDEKHAEPIPLYYLYAARAQP